MKFNLVTTLGFFPLNDICFGRLNSLPTKMSSCINGIISHNLARKMFYTPEDLDQFVKPEHILYIEFPITQCTRIDGQSQEQAVKYWEEEMLALLSSLPIYEGIWAYNEISKCFRVTTKAPSDQVMTLLFLIRNITINECRVYKAMRDRGYTHLQAAVGCHYVRASYCMGSSDKVPGDNKISSQWAGEYNWFNPQTMSEQSLLALFRQEPVKWMEGNFCESDKGYTRDGSYIRMEFCFMDFAEEPDYDSDYDYDEDDEDDDDDYSEPNGIYYKLIDIFSDIECYDLPFPSIQNNDNNYGFRFNRGVTFDEFLQHFNEFLKKV